MKIAIGGDHAGFQFKETIKEHLAALNLEIIDFGPKNEESCDYPDIAHPLAISIEKKEADFGIAICGSGNGISITLNKHQGIRSALCWNEELAELARLHNDANVLALPARFISIEMALTCVDVFLNTNFEGGRHQRRVEKIAIK
ncbi:MAG: ribose 5-phosphate isomerase B [Bacteroidetes bacterium]|nr:MAG: ribose 5-phosphate isomerase B [Bacteroidota bacterium]MBL1143728.1 ribose 5-phosphate isomerase B [Bacteroidota bacterium]NOG56530.1 ribose 5-phosphate isomerase B [Bacteroidota bacterium]